MPLRSIVNACHGDVYDGGHRANIPFPGHSKNDRSVSPFFNRDTGKVVAKCFAEGRADDWKVVMDDLQARGLIDRDHKPSSGGGSGSFLREVHAAPTPSAEKLSAVHKIWDPALPAARTLAEKHCHLRHVRRDLPGPDVLRFNRETSTSVYKPDFRIRRPALLLAVQAPDGVLTGLEITYLQPNGRRVEQGLRNPRRNMGNIPPSSAVRVDAPAPEMLVAEGFFSTLSATERFGLPGWALLSLRNLKSWLPPEGVRSVLVAGDNGGPGREGGDFLVHRLQAHGIAARAEYPPHDIDDWNKAAERERAAA